MDVASNPGLYYRHSGKFSLTGVVVAIVLGLLVGLACAWVYAYLIRWNPIVYINVLAAIGFAYAIGIVMESRLEAHKCRNVPLTGIIVLVVALIAYYVSWAVWLHALLAELSIPTVTLLLHPLDMWNLILRVNEVGAWSIRGDVVKGIPLWICWIAEAAGIVGAAVYIAVHTMQEATYCETCERFAKASKGVLFAGAGDAASQEKNALKNYYAGLKSHAAELKQHLEVKDFSHVEQLGAMKPGALGGYRFDLASCPQCNMTNTLSVTQLQHKVEGKKRKEKNTETKVLHHLLLSATEADAIKKLNEKLKMPLPQALATPAHPGTATGTK